MKVNVHIDRLVVDGVQLSRAERDALPAAVQRELERRLAPARREDARRPSAPGRAHALGRDIGGAIHRSLPSSGGGPR